jgi:hypothetical protein
MSVHVGGLKVRYCCVQRELIMLIACAVDLFFVCLEKRNLSLRSSISSVGRISLRSPSLPSSDSIRLLKTCCTVQCWIFLIISVNGGFCVQITQLFVQFFQFLVCLFCVRKFFFNFWSQFVTSALLAPCQIGLTFAVNKCYHRSINVVDVSANYLFFLKA